MNSRRVVDLYGFARAAPDAVGALHRVEPVALCCLAQRGDAVVLVDERGKRNQPSGAGEVGDDEPVEVVEHCPGDELAERAVIAVVRSLHRSEVVAALPLEHDHRRVAEADEDQVQGESACVSVAVEERVDAFE